MATRVDTRALLVFLIGMAAVFTVSQAVLAQQAHQTRIIQKESYITNLAATYNASIRECVSLSSSTVSEDTPPEEQEVLSQQILRQCVDSVNGQREAGLLSEWGRADLLEEAS